MTIESGFVNFDTPRMRDPADSDGTGSCDCGFTAGQEHRCFCLPVTFREAHAAPPHVLVSVILVDHMCGPLRYDLRVRDVTNLGCTVQLRIWDSNTTFGRVEVQWLAVSDARFPSSRTREDERGEDACA